MRTQFPFVPPDLLRALEEAFPDKLPSDPQTVPAEFSALVGEQRVIRFLRHRLALQEAPMRNP